MKQYSLENVHHVTFMQQAVQFFSLAAQPRSNTKNENGYLFCVLSKLPLAMPLHKKKEREEKGT